MKTVGSRVRILSAVVVAVLLPAALAGCASTEAKLIGQWQLPNSGPVVEFQEGGTGALRLGPINMPFQWSVADDTLNVDAAILSFGYSQQQTIESIDKEQLVLIDASGQRNVLTRVPTE